MSIGKNVKFLRLSKGLTQSQLATSAGIQLTQVSRVENNDTDPKASTLIKIIQALGCTANDVFNSSYEQPEPLNNVLNRIHELESILIAHSDLRSRIDEYLEKISTTK